ncbi:hypothetical protein M758_1G006900 [Ceratodon purpureus]|nr:hypothetical protein M758_1G006900 [Ceratodon purpureus]
MSNEERIGNIQTLLIGSLAGATASTSTFPLEVARKQMQGRSKEGLCTLAHWMLYRAFLRSVAYKVCTVA